MSRSGMANLITRVRELTNSRWERLTDSATGDGTTTVYWLTHKINEAGGTVSQGGTVTGTASYTWDTDDGRLAFSSAPAASVAILAEYRWSEFTDDHIEDVLESNCRLVQDSPLSWLPTSIPGGSIAYYTAQTPFRDLEGTLSGTAYSVVRDGSGDIVTGYTLDERQGLATFTVDQAGSAYYLTTRSYDVWAAAADVWQEKAAIYANQFTFTSDSQSFQRKELIENAKAMAEQCRRKSGQNTQRGDLKAGTFVRTDINRSTW